MPHARDVGFLPFALALCRTRYRPRRVWHLELRPAMSDAPCRHMGWGVLEFRISDVLGVLEACCFSDFELFPELGEFVIRNRDVRCQPRTASVRRCQTHIGECWPPHLCGALAHGNHTSLKGCDCVRVCALGMAADPPGSLGVSHRPLSLTSHETPDPRRPHSPP